MSDRTRIDYAAARERERIQDIMIAARPAMAALADRLRRWLILRLAGRRTVVVNMKIHYEPTTSTFNLSDRAGEAPYILSGTVLNMVRLPQIPVQVVLPAIGTRERQAMQN